MTTTTTFQGHSVFSGIWFGKSFCYTVAFVDVVYLHCDWFVKNMKRGVKTVEDFKGQMLNMSSEKLIVFICEVSRVPMEKVTGYNKRHRG